MTKEELLAQLKELGISPKQSNSFEFQEIIVEDNDTVDTVAKKFNKQMTEMSRAFNTQLESVKTAAVEEATAPIREDKRQTILRFKEAHPGMKNADVVAIMDPLYAKGKTLEEAYALACKTIGLDETTGDVPKVDDPLPKKAAKTTPKAIPPEEDLDDGDEGKKDDKPKTLMETINANANNLDATMGDVLKIFN